MFHFLINAKVMVLFRKTIPLSIVVLCFFKFSFCVCSGLQNNSFQVAGFIVIAEIASFK